MPCFKGGAWQIGFSLVTEGKLYEEISVKDAGLPAAISCIICKNDTVIF